MTFFWWFLLVSCLLIPVTLVSIGSLFCKRPPSVINPVFGFRTSLSMKNNDTWGFAHRYSGRIYKTTGWVLIPATVIAMLFCLGKDKDFTGYFSIAVIVVQMAALIIPIFFTQAALKKKFNPDGTLKK